MPQALLHPQASPVPGAQEFAQQVAQAIAITKDNLKRAQDRQARFANLNRREGIFEEGEEVLLSCQLQSSNNQTTPKQEVDKEVHWTLQDHLVGLPHCCQIGSTPCYEDSSGLPYCPSQEID